MTVGSRGCQAIPCKMRRVQLGEVEAAGENRSDGGITRVVRGVLEGRGRRKDGFAAWKEHRGRSSYEFEMDNRKQRQHRGDDGRLTESRNTRSEQLP